MEGKKGGRKDVFRARGTSMLRASKSSTALGVLHCLTQDSADGRTFGRVSHCQPSAYICIIGYSFCCERQASPTMLRKCESKRVRGKIWDTLQSLIIGKRLRETMPAGRSKPLREFRVLISYNHARLSSCTC